VINPQRVDDELIRLANLLEERAEDFGRAAHAAAVAEAAHKKSYAQEMLRVIDFRPKATVSEREARVELATADEYAARLITDATVKSVRESLAAIRAQIEAARTVAATLRHLTAPGF
jgi:hypothetical protein